MADQRSFVFGPGVVYGTVLSYTDGTAPAVAIPRKFDVLQDFSLDLTLSVKELSGQRQFPEAIGIGEGKASGRITNARIHSGVLNDLFLGRNPSTGVATGRTLIADPPESKSVPDTPGPYTLTVDNAAGFVEDLGVYDNDTGVQLTPVTAGPTTGQYSVNSTTGVYTFAAADLKRNVVIAYAYTSITGKTVSAYNELQGAVAISKMRYQGQYAGRKVGLYLPQVVHAKFGFATKQKDFVTGNFEYSAFSGADGIVAKLYLLE